MKTTFSFQKILLAFYAFIGLLIAVRIFYTGSAIYLFLVWNIFLAWIPCIISNLFKKMTKNLAGNMHWYFAAGLHSFLMPCILLQI